MIKNKKKVLELLAEKTGRTEEECIVINDVLENHFIIGHNNKEKIIKDFMEKLNIEYEEGNKLYNDCAEVIVKNIFKR